MLGHSSDEEAGPGAGQPRAGARAHTSASPSSTTSTAQGKEHFVLIFLTSGKIFLASG